MPARHTYTFDVEGHTVVTPVKSSEQKKEFDTIEFIEFLSALFGVGLVLVLFFAFIFPAIYHFCEVFPFP